MSEVRKVVSFKASPIGDQIIPDLLIELGGDIEKETMYMLPDIRDYFGWADEQAENIAEALWSTLPQGVFDRVAHKMMGKVVANSGYIHTGKSAKGEGEE